MSLKQKINEKLKEAMRAKDVSGTSALRQIKTEIMKVETRTGGGEVGDGDIRKILSSLVKQHQESIEIYEKNDRAELLGKEKAELETIRSFLPEELGLAELELLVAEVVAREAASSMKDMGKVMKALRSEIEAKGVMADGKLLSECVKKSIMLRA